MKRIISILLVIIMLSATLVGCAGGAGQDISTGEQTTETTGETTSDTTADTTADTSADTSGETSAETSGETSADTEGDVLPVGMIFDTVDNKRKTEHTIVYSLYTGTGTQSAVTVLTNAFEDNCRVNITARKENGYELLNPGMTGKKIVIGKLEKDPVAMEIYNSLNTTKSYIIKFVGDSLYIVGGSGEANLEAVEYFVATYLKKYITTKLFFEEGVIVENNAPAPVPNLTIAGNALDKYTIIHDGSAVGARFARELNTMLSEKTGRDTLLPIKNQKDFSGEYEILVGKTDRAESVAARADYDRPNVYYDVEVVGKKLVCMGEGWYTLGKIVEALGEHFNGMAGETPNLTGKVLSGDMIDEIDNSGMLTMAEGTDVRVLNYNLYGTTYDYDNLRLFSGDTERGEVIADIMLAYYPDVITTNELYLNTALIKAIKGQISDYYIHIDNSAYDEGFPFENSTAGGRGNPEQIFIKKDKFTVVDSGWRYTSEGNGEVVNFHGIHWAVLQTPENKKFIISVGHYADSNYIDTYAREQIAAIEMAQASSGSSETLPAVAAGDFFAGATGSVTYRYYIETCGFIDPQRIVSINRNLNSKGEPNINQATHHTFGQGEGDGTRIDFILHNDKFTPLKFKVLKSNELNYTSDHYPECVDLKLPD